MGRARGRWMGAAVLLLMLPAAGFGEGIEEVLVTARLREQPLDSVAASISVLPAALIERRQANHFEEILNTAPNVNFSAGASRGRFVQIRGIGERSEFVDPLDSSVGLYIDDIDFSGMGNAGTLFDAEQVEILRGPQGTAFGASAMAGLINIRSALPTAEREARLEAGVSEYGGSTLGAVLSGPLGQTLGARLALHRNRADGFMKNDFLGRDDTNAIDESTARARLDWQVGERLELGLTALHLDADNGYDAFSLDNDRHTLSDQPGRDRQQSNALALRANWQANTAFEVQARVTWSASDRDYGYDEDWSHPGLCTGTPCEGWEYSSTDRYIRDVDAGSIDLRLVSHAAGTLDWVGGVYIAERDTALERRFFDFDADAAARFDSDYQSTRGAAYGELSWQAAPRWTVVTGLRAERFDADYDDSLAVRARPGENLWGGQLSIQFAPTEDAMLYALLARGYKAGGVNGDAIGKARQSGLDPSIIAFLQTRLEFDTETLCNYELGYKAALADAALRLRVALFWMERQDVQLKAWYNEGPQFVGYTDNAASGRNRGLELEADWQPLSRLGFNFSLGLLDTRIEDFVANDPDAGFVDKSGRDQAQAPNWQFSAAAEFAFSEHAWARLEVEGKDGYYLSDSDDQRSSSYQLLHATAGYRLGSLEATLWVHNLLDEDYVVHGFYFGNDPRNFYANEAYYQFGAPRVAGLTLVYQL